MTTRDQFEARLLASLDDIVAGYEDAYRSDNPNGLWESWAESEKYRLRSCIQRWVGYVPPVFRSADLAKLGPEQHGDALRGYLTGTTRNLMLAGPIGTGKSFAAWAVANEAAARGWRPRAWSTPRLLLDMRPEGDPQAFTNACLADLLILDDLGAARPTDWATEQIYSIAEERCNQQLRTIVTTNSTFDQLTAIWGAPTMDRLRHAGTSLVFKGDSRRGPV